MVGNITEAWFRDKLALPIQYKELLYEETAKALYEKTEALFEKYNT